MPEWYPVSVRRVLGVICGAVLAGFLQPDAGLQCGFPELKAHVTDLAIERWHRWVKDLEDDRGLR